ncbi:MAG TPA: YggS family pyridoxal phosphate-dependent enzyme [Propionibacteriaceae bacterium]|nr:YggS family pyridoxal phosphate-dependent enzyme [Propionibacteriaceae bacterium]
MSEVGERVAEIRAQVSAACVEAGRDAGEVRLLAVSKTRPAQTVRQAYEAGCRWFGENRLQELREKAGELAELRDLSWSVIGHVQRNKAQIVVDLAAELQSLDSVDLAAELERRLDAADRTLDVLVQVNTSGEVTKSGLRPEEVGAFAKALRPYERLVPRGLMTIALPSDDDREVAACFESLRSVQARLRDTDGEGWDELSMGMSSDFRLAIAHGSTCVRIGSALFGPRL